MVTVKSRPLKRKMILVVDDEKDMGWIFQEVIKEAGHKVSYAPTYKEGMRKFRSLKDLNIAIVDLELDASKNGLAFIKEARGVSHKVKFIMISALGTGDIKEKAKKAGFSYFLDKPTRIEGLLDIINYD